MLKHKAHRQNSFTPKLTVRFLLIVLGVMFIIHLVVFVYYAQRNKHDQAKVNHDIMVQQVLNLIERIYTTPMQGQVKVAEAVDVPNISISVDNQAKSKLRLPINSTLWEINRKIDMQNDFIQLSLQLASSKWLNIYASIGPTKWWLQLFLLTLEILVVSAAIVSLWSINRFALPLQEFRKAADRLGIDLDPPPIAEYGPSVVRETAQAMNKMSERITALIQERTQMLAALSHDLRTPITRLKLRTQFINDAECYQKMMHDLDEMEQMIADTLAFAKNDSYLENMVKFDLNSLLLSIANDFRDMGFAVDYHYLSERILLHGRPLALKRAVTNLVENAMKYAGPAVIKVEQDHKFVTIYIDDHGSGLPEELLEKVFTPFYRVDPSRSRHTGGTGLGLSIARDIIRAHHGVIRLRNRPEGGLQAMIKLPFKN